MLLLSTPAVAEVNQFSENGMPAITTSAVATFEVGSVTLTTSETTEGTRLPIMLFGIAAVAYTFHRAVFRRRQQA